MIDYSTGSFMLPIELADEKGYASVHTNLYRDDTGLDFGGDYFVYLLHPQMGSAAFTIVPVSYGQGYRAKGSPVWVQNEIISEIIKEIKTRFNRQVKVAEEEKQ